MKKLTQKSLIFSLLFLFFTVSVQAQNLVVTGTVKDVIGPVVGASVIVKGEPLRTLTVISL